MKYKVFTCGQLQTNCVVLQKETSCVVVDVPYPADEVARYVLNNGLKVEGILLTHGHFDHCGGVARFCKQCNVNAPVLVNKNDLSLCLAASQNAWGVVCEDCHPSGFLQEGELRLGEFKFSVLQTGGHTAGSVVIFVEDVMLSGDTLFCGSIGRTDFSESNAAEMQRSLKKLAEITKDYHVICGHGEQTSLACEQRQNKYLRFWRHY